MNEYIPFEDFVPYAEDLLRGEQIHINHDDCSAGADTKRRLYIKRTEDGTHILAYCHNCSLHGCYDKGFSRALHNETGYNKAAGEGSHRYADARPSCESIKTSGEGREVTGRLPQDFDIRFENWGTERRLWVTRYGIEPEKELKKYQIGVSSSRNSVILPVFRDKKLIGYQERNFNKLYPDGKPVPKYSTKRFNGKPLWWYSEDYAQARSAVSGGGTTVIVEDMLSGIKCARLHPTIALLGAAVSDDLLAFIIDKVPTNNTITIFLDDDNRQVRLNQLKIKVRLEQIGYRVKLITGVGKDPKACSNNDLKELL